MIQAISVESRNVRMADSEIIFQFSLRLTALAINAPNTPTAAASVTVAKPPNIAPRTRKMIKMGKTTDRSATIFSRQLARSSGGSAGPICGCIQQRIPM